MIQKRENPIAALPQKGDQSPREKTGRLSMKPMKKRMEGRKVKAGLIMTVDSWMLQGAIAIQTKVQAGERPGTRRWMYQVRSATPRMDSRFTRMKGASGTGRAIRGPAIK